MSAPFLSHWEKGDALGCGFASRGELHGGEPIGPGVYVVDPLVDYDGGRLDAVARDRGPCLVRKRVPDGRRVQDGDGRSLREAREVDGGSNRGEIGRGGATRDEHELRGAGRLERGVRGVRRRVDDGELGAGSTRRLEDRPEACGLGARDDRSFRLAQIAPFRRGGLRVEVDEHRREPGALRGDGGCAGERRLAGAALLTDECESQHPITILC